MGYFANYFTGGNFSCNFQLEMLLCCKLQEKLPHVTETLPDATKINHCIGAARVGQLSGHKVGIQDSGKCDSTCSTFLSDYDFEIKLK